jgi:AcrR family transcriptional regulator
MSARPLPGGCPGIAIFENKSVYDSHGRDSAGHLRRRLDSEVAMGEPARAGRAQARPAHGSNRRPDQLPSGRHGLLRSFVAANQRERILSAVAQAVAELGYAEMSVEAVIARAGVSRRTFYEHFRNKEDAFFAAYDAAVHQVVRHIRRAYLNEATAQERLRAGVKAFLQFLAGGPELARMCIVEVLAAGPRAIARRNEAMRMFAEIIEDNIHELVPSCRRPALTAETIVGGIHEAVFSRILTGRIDELPGLADDLLVAILMLDVDPQELSPGTPPPPRPLATPTTLGGQGAEHPVEAPAG